MFKLDCKELLDELSVISQETETMGTRAQDVILALRARQIELADRNEHLTKLMMAQKLVHYFMLNHNFDLLHPDAFDQWADIGPGDYVDYTLSSRPEYRYRTVFIFPNPNSHVTVLLERYHIGPSDILLGVSSECISITNTPEISDLWTPNVEYLIEVIFLNMASNFSALWTRFHDSIAELEDEDHENLLPVL